MDIFINSFLVVMLPIIGIVVFIREGWKAALRFFGILVLPLFLIIGIAYYLFDSLSDRNLRVLGIGIAVLSLGYLLARSLESVS